jgi:hypothetical protein
VVLVNVSAQGYERRFALVLTSQGPHALSVLFAPAGLLAAPPHKGARLGHRDCSALRRRRGPAFTLPGHY